MSYPGFPHVQYGQYGERTLQYHWAGQSWSHVSHCWYPTLWQPPAERRHITQMLLLVSEWVCESKRVSMWECVCVCVWVSESHRCGHQNGATSGAELLQCLLSVSLGTVSMDTSAGVSLAIQEVLKGISSLLGLHKHQRQGVLTWEGHTWKQKYI